MKSKGCFCTHLPFFAWIDISYIGDYTTRPCQMERIIDPYQNPNEPTSIQSFFVCANFSTEELGEVIPYMLQVEPSRRPGVLEVNHFLQGPLWKSGEGTSQSEECHFESW